MNEPTIRQPTVFLPLAMSLVVLAMVLVHFAIFGIVDEIDEGTAAHIFQLVGYCPQIDSFFHCTAS
jgi:hypothetical protein